MKNQIQATSNVKQRQESNADDFWSRANYRNNTLAYARENRLGYFELYREHCYSSVSANYFVVAILG